MEFCGSSVMLYLGFLLPVLKYGLRQISGHRNTKLILS